MNNKILKRWIIGGVAGVILILIVSVVGLILDARKSAKVKIMVAPVTATVTIGESSGASSTAGVSGGREYGAMEEVRIEPGEYVVTVAAEGFLPKTGKLKAVTGETAAVSLFLEPMEGNENYYALHPDDALIVGEIKNALALERLSDLKEKWPVLELLPIEIDYYTAGHARRVWYKITYELSDEYEAGFRVVVNDYTGGNYNDALRKLEARGVEVVDGAIVGTDETEASVVYVDKTGSLRSGRAE